jgi:hypothetical protein
MLRALDPVSRAEIARALLIESHPEPTAAQKRVDELLALADMLHELRPPVPAPKRKRDQVDLYGVRGVRLAPPDLPREDYDLRRPAGAPASDTLARGYGGWRKACRAAYGLKSDGRYVGAGKPWRSVTLPDQLFYTREDCAAAIRRCGLYLGRVPSSHLYYRWQRATKSRLPPRRYAAERIPGIKRILSLYRSWDAALAEARLDERSLIEVRRGWAQPSAVAPVDQSARELLAGLSDEVCARAAITRQEQRQVTEQGPDVLLLDQARALSNLSGAPVALLTGVATELVDLLCDGGPAIREAIREAGVRERDLADRLGWSVGAVRRMVNGRLVPTVGEAQRISALLAPPRAHRRAAA